MEFGGRHIEIRGVVQGVGFRPWVYRLALARGLGGWVRNDANGVTIEAFGPPAAIEAFLGDLRAAPPPAAHIASMDVSPLPPRALESFAIIASEPSSARRVSIPADLPTCPDCLAEILDPANRRYRYAFTNCTNCGPRFTIARDIPYDRPFTTMAPFQMCRACQAEYDDPADRRFHAQPNACPRCGPHLWLADGNGVEGVETDPIVRAAAALMHGQIVALKGLGGVHLACDATDEAAVAELRRRKRRDEKPFAVMVVDLEEAQRLANISVEERRLLTSIERPIVLVTRRPSAPLADGIAPGNPLIGLMLPYTPLHHLLVRAAGRPLVMTSGNLSEEPLAYRNDEAVSRLKGIADLFLLHDRDIETRCDDSVTRVIAGEPVVLRRSRGYVPHGIPVRVPFAQPVLACGALLKNTFCIGTGDVACLGPHIGDLENLETYELFEHAIARMERFLDVRIDAVAHDAHPDYLSTRYAHGRRARQTIAVQHHHAHVASAMAEHGLDGPVVGVAFDGTGYGSDGSAWGGEILIAEWTRFTRVATLRPLTLAGGDTAVRQVWRQALALVLDACGPDAPVDRLAVFDAVDPRELATVRQMIEQGINTARAHGAGRYFDATGALGLGRTRARYEGQIALEWNLTADSSEDVAYAFELDGRAGVAEIDLRPAVRALVADLLDGRGAATVSARFHNTLAAAAAAAVARALRLTGPVPVVLTGGVFQNARLAETVTRLVEPRAPVWRHRLVPPGDGGIALGQAVIANALIGSGAIAASEEPCV